MLPGWVCLLAAVVLIAVTADVLAGGLLTRIDHAISGPMRDTGLHDSRFPHYGLYFLTWFGQRGPVLLVSVPVFALLSWRMRSLEPLLRLIVAFLALAGVVYAMKYAIGRAAPPVDRLHRSGLSYPSGHVANAILVWGLLAHQVARGLPGSRVLPALRVLSVVAPLAVVVGMTLLDYHWFTDFIGGAAVGVLLLALATVSQWSRIAERLDRSLVRR